MHKVKCSLIAFLLVVSLVSGCSFNKDDEEGLTEQEIEQLDVVNNNLDSLRESEDYKNMDIEAQTSMMMKAIKEQAAAGYIDADSITLDEEQNIISYVYKSGIRGFEKIGGWDDYVLQTQSSTLDLSNEDLFPNSDAKTNAEAIILNAFDKNNEDKEGYAMLKQLAKKWNDDGLSTVCDETVTLDDIANLKGYKISVLFLHGVYQEDVNESFIYTNEKINSETSKKYADDLYERKGDNIKDKPVVRAGNGYYAISSGFFKKHYNPGDFEGDFVFFGSCQLMGFKKHKTEAWADVTTDYLRSPAFVGFHNSVHQDYSIALVNTYVENLMKGKKAKEALNLSMDINGKSDLEAYKKEITPFGYYVDQYFLRVLDRANGVEKRKSEEATPNFRGDENAVLMWSGFSDSESSDDTQYENLLTETPTPTPTPDPSVLINETNFPDNEFRRCISNEYDLDHNGALSPEEISKVTSIDLFDHSVEDTEDEPPTYAVENLQGIEFFSELGELYIHDRGIKTADISKNLKLKNMTLFECCQFESITIRCGQSVILDHITTSVWQHEGRTREYLADVSDESIVSRSFPYFGSEATSFTGIKAGEVTVNGTRVVVNGKITVLPDDSYTPKPVVSVNNAVDKQFTYEGESYDYKIPEVIISGKDTNAVNNKIQKDLSKYSFYEDGNSVPIAITYSKYVDDKVVSLCVRVYSLGMEEYDNTYYVYNVSLKTGKIMSDKNVVKHCEGQYDEKAFLDGVRSLLSYFVDKNRPEYYDDAFVKKLKKSNDATVDKKFKKIKPFVSDEDHFCIVVPIEWYGGMGKYNVKVDMLTQEIKWEGSSASGSKVTPTPTPTANIAIDKKHFPDSEFRRLIKDRFDKNHDGKLSVKERNAVKEFDTYADSDIDGSTDSGPYTYGIENPQGIEYFTELKEVCFSFSSVISIDMTKNPKLKNVEFFDSCRLDKAVMLEGQTLKYSSITEWAEYESGDKRLYCKSNNTKIVTVSRIEKKCNRTLVTAKNVGQTTIKYNDGSLCAITVKSKKSAKETSAAISTKTDKPTIKVKTQLNKKLDAHQYGMYKFQIPKITISGVDTSAANKKMYNELIKYLNEPGEPYEVTFEHYNNDGFVSIVVLIAKHNPYNFYRVYNVSTKTGKLMNGNDVLKIFGVSEKDFFESVRKEYKKSEFYDSTTDYTAMNLKRVSMKYLMPYGGPKGKMYFAGSVYHLCMYGDNPGYLIFGPI